MDIQTIKINHNQVLSIVVWDLIDKYKYNIERGDKKWVAAFENVLRYYLDEEEMSLLKIAISTGQLPSNPLDLFENDNPANITKPLHLTEEARPVK